VPSDKVRGILLAGAAAALFGASTPVAKLLSGKVDPILLAALFYLGSGLSFSLIALVKRLGGIRANGAAIKNRDLPYLALIVLSGGIAAPVLLMSGLQQCSAVSASLLLNLETAFTAVIAWVCLRENFDRRVIFGVVAITAGGVMLSLNNSADSLTPAFNFGSVFIALACLCWAIDNNITRQVADLEPSQIALIKGLAAGCVNFTLAAALHQQLPPWPIVLAAMAVGFLGYGVSLVLYVLALRYLGSARSSAYFATAPFIGALLSIIIFHNPVGPALLIAALLMAVGVYLHISEHHEHRHKHEAMEHEHEHVHDIDHRHAHRPEDEPVGGLKSGVSHSHKHSHDALEHNHPHYPDLHHRHEH